MHTYTVQRSTHNGKRKIRRKPVAFASQTLPAHAPFVQRKANCSCGGNCPSCQGTLPIQAKLNVSKPNDRYEREADRVASQIMESRTSGPAGPEISILGHTPQIYRISDIESPTEEDAMSVPGNDTSLADEEETQVQRMAENVQDEEEETHALHRMAENEEEEEDPTIQRLKIVGPAKGSKKATQQAFNRRLAGTRNQGQPLNPAQQRFMESRFKRDFSQVRVHDDSQAKHLSNDIQARAFTLDNHIYFNQGEYRPESPSGKNVLAHELTHVVQQGAATVKGVNAPVRTAPAISNRSSAKHSNSKVDRMSALGPGDTPVATGVRPWTGSAHPVGSDYIVQTDGGSNVVGWVAYSPYKNNLRYWCHGFSLSTYQNNVWGYSVYSGTPMKTVVKDEWKAIPPARARPGDIAVWSKYQHSAIFTSVSKTSGGGLDENATKLDSKNGQIPLANYSLAQLKAVKIFGPRYHVYRHK